MIRKTLIAIAVVTGSLLLAQPALAVTWYSTSSPLKVYDGGRVQGLAYGNFTNYNGVSARSYSWQKDSRPGGSGIYVETKFWWYGPDSDCTQQALQHGAVCWYDSGKKSTANTISGSWIAAYSARYLVFSADRARGDIKVCENHSWAHDPCSAHVLRTFSY